MKTSGYLLLVVFVGLSIAGCENNEPIVKETVVGEGPVITVDLSLPPFSEIVSTGVANFYIDTWSTQSVIVKVQDNIMNAMTYRVVDETLEVGLKKNVSIENYEEIRFNITIPSISSITLAGVGNFELSGGYQDELTINLTGVGDVKAYGLRVGTCTITSTGVGNCQVHVLDVLDVTITGIGNVYYRGDPTITSSITGLGQLIDSN